MSDDALMQPITLPIVAIRLTIAAAYMRGVNAGDTHGRAAHGDRDAVVDELMANCVRQASDLAHRDTQQRAGSAD